MKSLAWKLAIVAAVAGVGFLVILQAQRAMTQALANKAEAPSASSDQPPTSDQPTTASQPPSSEHSAATDHPPVADKAHAGKGGDPFDPAFGQDEPTHSGSKATPSPGSNGTQQSATQQSAAAQPTPKEQPIRTADNTKPGQENAASAADPFGEAGGAKQPNGPMNLTEPPAPGGPAVSPANATAVEGPSNGKPQTQPNPGAPQGGPAVPGAAPPAQSEPNQAASGDGKPQPSGAPPLELPAGGKNDSGPQLLGPGGEQDAAGNGPPGKPASAAGPALPSGGAAPGEAPSTSPAANAAGGNQPSRSTGSPFPSDDGGPEPGRSHDDSSTHPSPFPGGAGKELPVPNAMAGAAAARPPDQPTAGTPRTEGGPDFQGDGTVGEQAPLGPQRPQLSIEKIAPQNALIGQPLIYSIIVKNSGASEAHEVVVEDRIPKGTRLSGTIPRAELSGKKLAWRLGNLGPGEQRKISIRVVPLEAGEIGSVATVNFVAEAAAETVITAPKLQFELTGRPTARVGESVPFHFTVTNVGTGEARGVVIRDLIPDAFSHAAGSDLEYEVGRLPAGKSKELTLDLKAVKVGPTVNRALVIAEGGVSIEKRASVEIIGSKIGLSRSGPTRRYLGRPAVYSNTITNESKFALEGVSVVESVPSGMEFAGASHGGQYNDGTHSIAWTIERMVPGETWVVKSKLLPKAPGSQTSTVRVMIPNAPPVQTTGETIVEGFAALGLEVQSVDGPIDVGGKLTLRINVRNKGSVVVTNAVVSVAVPEQMQIVSARGPGSHEQHGNVVRFGPIPTLEGRTAAACELVLEAQKRGDSRIDVSLQADQLQKPLSREEPVLILSDSPSPTAAR